MKKSFTGLGTFSVIFGIVLSRFLVAKYGANARVTVMSILLIFLISYRKT